MVRLRSRNLLLLVGASLLAVLAAGLAILYGFGYGSEGANATVGNASQVAPEVGAQAPDFELIDLGGESVRISDYLGKPVLVNFWATWCAPCVLEMPNIQKYYERYPGAFSVIAVNADESRNTVEGFVEDMGLTFPVVLDPGSKVQTLYRLLGYPTTYFLDAEGMVQFRHIGLLREKDLEEYLVKMGAIQ